MPGDRAVIADPDLDAGLDQIARDVGLDIGKPITRSGSSLRISPIFALVNAETFGFFLARTRRTHGEARDTDDAVFLADRVEDFGRLFGQADDAFGIHGGATSYGYSCCTRQVPSMRW